MNLSILFRVFICILSLGFFLYAYIEKQNAITQLRLEIPPVLHELQAIEQENIRLRYEIDRFENPMHLMELSRRPEFSHLKYPLVNEIWTIDVPKDERQ